MVTELTYSNDLNYRIRLKYDQISESVDRFDLYLRKENLCQIMRSLVKEGQNASNIDSLVHNIRQEANDIMSSMAAIKRSTNESFKEPGSNLLAEFQEFEMSMKKSCSAENGHVMPSTKGKTWIYIYSKW